jgi:hypothetical protein
MATSHDANHDGPSPRTLTGVLAVLMLGVLLWLFYFLDSTHFQTVVFFFEDGHWAALNAFGVHHGLA